MDLIAEFYLVDRGLRHRLPGFSSLGRLVVLFLARDSWIWRICQLRLRNSCTLNRDSSRPVRRVVSQMPKSKCWCVFNLYIICWELYDVFESRPSSHYFAMFLKSRPSSGLSEYSLFSMENIYLRVLTLPPEVICEVKLDFAEAKLSSKSNAISILNSAYLVNCIWLRHFDLQLHSPESGPP